jgi:hypothetical protein
MITIDGGAITAVPVGVDAHGDLVPWGKTP